jgi:hypothetical protein
MGPYPTDSNSNKYIIHFVCSFSRFSELTPVPDLTAISVAKALVQCIISRYGIPGQLHTDMGSEFDNHLLKALCELLSLPHTFSVPYAHHTNGLVERRNKEALRLLKILTLQLDKYETWSEVVPMIQIILNTSTCSVTGCTPFSLIYGTDTLPRRTMLDVVANLDEPLRPLDDSYLTCITDSLSDMWKQAQAAQHDYLQKRLQRSTRTATSPTFKTGDLVLRSDLAPINKMHSLLGPYRVRSTPSSSTVLVESLISNNVYKVAKCYLKLFDSRRSSANALRRLAASDSGEYVVERILEHLQDSNGQWWGLVKWEGYDSPTWLPAADLIHNDAWISYRNTVISPPGAKRRQCRPSRLDL